MNTALITLELEPIWYNYNYDYIGLTFPSNKKKNLPIFLFGEYDRKGGHLAGHQLINYSKPQINGYDNYNKIGTVCVDKMTQNLFSLDSDNEVDQTVWQQKYIAKLGDVFYPILYRDFDTLTYPFANSYYLGMVRVRALNISASSFIRNTGEHANYYLNSINYSSDNILNYNENIYLVTFKPDGSFAYNSINPRAYKGSDVVQNDIITIPINSYINQYKGIYTLFLKETIKITLALNINY